MSEWREYKLEGLVEKFIDYRGKTPQKATFGIPLITAKIVKNGTIYPPNEFISESDYLNWMTRGFPKKNDVVVTTEAPLGEVALLKDEMVALAQRIILIRCKKGQLDNAFLKYYLQSNIGHEELEMRSSGTTVTGIKSSELKQILIRCPQYGEQCSIASILSSLDDKIDILRRQNATLESMAETLFRQWFIVEAQDDWDEGTLASIAHQNKNNINPSDFPYEVFNVYSMPAYDADKKPEVTLGKDILSNKTIIEDNSILISKLNPQFPRIWIISDSISKNSVSSTEFINIIPKDKNLISFIYLLLTSNDIINELAHAASGTSGSHQRVTVNDIFNITFKYPSIEYLNVFSDKCAPLLMKINTNRIQIRTLERLRDTLLPKLMSGEIRVRCDEGS